MASIYSVRLGEETAATAGFSDLYTVPAASIIVVRDISALCETTGSNVAGILRSGGPFIAFFSSAAANTAFRWEGRAVFEAAEILQLEVGSGTWQVSASGYLLTS